MESIALHEPCTVPIPKAARQLGISRSLAYKLAAEGRFPCKIIRAGQRILVVRSDLDRMLAGE